MKNYLIRMRDDCDGKLEFVSYETDRPVNLQYIVDILGKGFHDIQVFEEVV